MKKILLVLCFPIFLFNFSFAQNEYFAKKHQYGISIGFHANKSSLKTLDAAAIGLADEFNGVESRIGEGFELGIMYRYQINSFLAARTQAVISFAEDRFFFDANTFPDATLARERVNLEFPLHLVFEKMDKKVSPSFFFGGRYKYDLAESTRWAIVDFRNNDIALDIGAGLTFHYKRFKFKPELIYSRGLREQVERESTYQKGRAVDSVFTNQFGLRLSFYN